MISKVRGQFNRFTGTIDIDEQDPSRSRVEVQIEADSIDTGQPQRDADLKSPNYLDAENYPYLTFKSKRVEVADGIPIRLIGDLTIRDVTREVMLDVEYAGEAKSPMGNVSAGYSATTKIDRKDFGLTWNMVLETGGVLVGDEVTIDIELEVIKQTEEAMAG
jgi:polyisoprenoid-binding protein YceI